MVQNSGVSKSGFVVKGQVSEGVAHLNLPLPGTPGLDLWGNRQAPVVQHHPFLNSRKRLGPIRASVSRERRTRVT
jgi:hypothetical protein